MGISLNGGDNNTIRDNTVSHPAVSAVPSRGIHLFDASGNEVIGNQVTGMRLEGIYIQQATVSVGNRVHGNTATGNATSSTTTDLKDDHGDCNSNQWTGNTFGTASPSCIR